MNFQLTEEQILIQKTARAFADNELAPGVVERDDKKIWPREGVKQMGELGFMGMMVDPKWDGGGMDSISYTIAMEEISRVEASSGVVMSVNNSLVCYLLEKFGSDFLKEKYLKPLASGKKLGAFSLSEPQSGSDASNMRTIAKKEGDHYIISGTKNWVTNGINSNYVILFAVTEKGIGYKGVSCFIVEKGWDGLETGKPENKLGIRASDTCELYFDNVKVPVENLIGKEGEGFTIALVILDAGRIGIASQAIGIAQASLNASVSYSRERIQFGKPIAKNQAIQFKIADMAMEIEAARLLIRQAAWKKDQKQNYGHIASMAKVYASEVAMRASTQCVQIHGGFGYMRESGIERLMRDAKITQIYEGTSEIQRIVIARELLKK
ncbi:MAG TPA: acyl-CoA dehydrogenase [Candidatus Marinimicrobia bacterium]|jgi:alkylation response protein AidB-like acyl-CoA dehydrogenase|nr:MAG: acyl-CoA dehydrogenase [Candidatus Neomarinimicrobiota bacterium]HIB14544.1 acyl-CoA dehydrogenase [Candidatus Neomarinimicrobiota bacterium]HIG50987.1 acyl-CoA dehydrogenase [Candidatus Neomarinimicrobiota bacterium]HIN19866.1 acyl-CoA dehydrogenase [Candidatus Neomarinimicrobiota bacterium]|tara:strand:- start:1308 stop:2450 length:1143 start_codon:yes stop_codon:yes gene_type:complete